MVTNKEIERAILEKYPNSRIELKEHTIVRGQEEIVDESFRLNLQSNMKDYSFSLFSPFSGPRNFLRKRKLESGVEIKCVDIFGKYIPGKYYKLPFFGEYINEEISKRGLGLIGSHPYLRVSENILSLDNIFMTIEKVVEARNFIDEKYKKNRQNILEKLRDC